MPKVSNLLSPRTPWRLSFHKLRYLIKQTTKANNTYKKYLLEYNLGIHDSYIIDYDKE